MSVLGIRRAGLIAAAAFVFANITAPTAGHATTYFFTEDGSGGKLGGDLAQPGYGQVDVTTVGADLEFQLTMAPSWFVDTGNATVHHPVAFNLSVSGLQISATAGTYTAVAPPLSGVSGSGFTNPSFQGPFNYAINCSSNGANGCNKLSSLTFYVLGAGSLSPVLTDGVFITADILSSLTGKTGVVGAIECDTCASPPPRVPLPATMPLFAGGLAGMTGLLAWRRRKNKA